MSLRVQGEVLNHRSATTLSKGTRLGIRKDSRWGMSPLLHFSRSPTKTPSEQQKVVGRTGLRVAFLERTFGWQRLGLHSKCRPIARLFVRFFVHSFQGFSLYGFHRWLFSPRGLFTSLDGSSSRRVSIRRVGGPGLEWAERTALGVRICLAPSGAAPMERKKNEKCFSDDRYEISQN